MIPHDVISKDQKYNVLRRLKVVRALRSTRMDM